MVLGSPETVEEEALAEVAEKKTKSLNEVKYICTSKSCFKFESVGVLKPKTPKSGKAALTGSKV